MLFILDLLFLKLVVVHILRAISKDKIDGFQVRFDILLVFWDVAHRIIEMLEETQTHQVHELVILASNDYLLYQTQGFMFLLQSCMLVFVEEA